MLGVTLDEYKAAYVETFENKSDVMLIDSDSEFFKYLNDKKDEK